MKLGIDIDGVMYNWESTARYMLRNVLPNSSYKHSGVLDEPSTTWNWIPDKIDKKHWNWLWKEGVELGLFRYGNLYPGTVDVIRALSKKHKITLITHRPKQAVKDTLAWLGFLDLPIAGLHILTDQAPKSEVRPMCDVYLDDKIENIEDLQQNTKAKLVCLMDQPWNQEYEAKTRVHDWWHFLALVRGSR